MFATILLIEAAPSAFSYLTYSLLDREVLCEEGASFFPNNILYIEYIIFSFFDITFYNFNIFASRLYKRLIYLKIRFLFCSQTCPEMSRVWKNHYLNVGQVAHTPLRREWINTIGDSDWSASQKSIINS